ncbi:ferredoxin [Streptomyces sp. Z26]|uniref:ferredoxin n=1 Tax=Streptomyces TaxID=1883 RepID=UPI000EF16565|nr:ferredoxin [Streptomyces sp. Z26]RLL66767.1 ferredoxin [Streptomyces sp. Z26]
MDRHHIEVDKDVCVGAGMCAITAPAVFTQDDDGLSEVIPGKEQATGETMTREALRACPVQAISVADG